MEGLRDPDQRADHGDDLNQLRREANVAREGLRLRTEELEAAQARLTQLEQKLRLIYQSRPYRLAWRLWGIRAKTRALTRLRSRASRAQEAEEMKALAPDEVAYAAGYMEVTKQPLPNGHGSQVEAPEDAQRMYYYGSRGVRATDQEASGPLNAVLLLGGLTEEQLETALRALAVHGPANDEPLVITDCDALRTLDSAGYLYEYIPPREDWETRLGRDGDAYDRFVDRRLTLIAATYGLASVPQAS